MATRENCQRIVKVGYRDVAFPSTQLQSMEDCNHYLHDMSALRKEMNDKGYLLIRGLHDRDDVFTARQAVLNYIHSLGDKLDKNHSVNEGVLRAGCGLGCLPVMEGHTEISHTKPVLKVIAGERPFKFFSQYFDEDVTTFDYKWLRAMHHSGFTGAHVDNVYMCRGSKDLLTMWTPIGDITVEMGVLAVCEGSNNLPSFQRFQSTYGAMDAELVGLKGEQSTLNGFISLLQGTGWFTEDPFEITEKFGGLWKTTDFKAGDVLIFNMRTVHMSTTNTTQFARISCDTRWQPSSQPADPRFSGNVETSKAKFGLLSKMNCSDNIQTFTTIEKLKEEWGL